MVNPSNKKWKAKETGFSLLAPSAQGVFLAGGFITNGISLHMLLRRYQNGIMMPHCMGMMKGMDFSMKEMMSKMMG